MLQRTWEQATCRGSDMLLVPLLLLLLLLWLWL
jgi:hypothetical protein